MAGPGVRASTPSDALVELVDIAPTLLDLCGLPVPARMQGCSMCALLDGRDDWSKRHVIAEYNDALGSVEHARPVHASMYRDGTHKIVVYHGEGLGELYDLREDPREFDDLWDSPAHAGLRAQLIARHFDAMMATSDAGIARVGMG
jgi:arylsulfatase A-like enzyme